MKNIKAGDVVRLKSGGPKMTVNHVQPGEVKKQYSGNIECYWFVDAVEIRHGSFSSAALKNAKKTKALKPTEG
tara:strand:+ start:2176 stop:2394 length:219 start_codon:yes stop_codon:yes gene_type:complete